LLSRNYTKVHLYFVTQTLTAINDPSFSRTGWFSCPAMASIAVGIKFYYLAINRNLCRFRLDSSFKESLSLIQDRVCKATLPVQINRLDTNSFNII